MNYCRMTMSELEEVSSSDFNKGFSHMSGKSLTYLKHREMDKEKTKKAKHIRNQRKNSDTISFE